MRNQRRSSVGGEGADNSGAVPPSPLLRWVTLMDFSGQWWILIGASQAKASSRSGTGWRAKHREDDRAARHLALPPLLPQHVSRLQDLESWGQDCRSISFTCSTILPSPSAKVKDQNQIWLLCWLIQWDLLNCNTFFNSGGNSWMEVLREQETQHHRDLEVKLFNEVFFCLTTLQAGLENSCGGCF